MNPAQSYQDMKILTSSAEQLVVIMYEETINSLKKAKILIESKDIGGAGEKLNRAHMIVSELICGLNFDYEEMSSHLFAMYSHINKNIIKANVNKDTKIIDDLIGFISPFLDAWKVAAKNVSRDIQTQTSMASKKIGINA